MQLSDYITQLQFLLHDQTNADFSQAELINAINNAREVTALDFQCCRTGYLSAPSGPINPNTNIGPYQAAAYQPVSVIPNQEIYPLTGAPYSVLNGMIVGATVTLGGSGYSPATTVTFPAPPGVGTQAFAVPVIADGVITSINMTQWGAGYAPVIPLISIYALPNITIADTGGGTGAMAKAVMFSNVFNVISISYIWGNQRYMLRFRAFSLFQAYMRSQLGFYQRGMIWTIHPSNGTVLIQPPPDQPYQTEWDVLSTPVPLLLPTDYEVQILPPFTDAVKYYAAHYCLNKLQNFNQAEYYLKLYSARVPKIIYGQGPVRIPNPYNKTFQRRVSR
jgi:hypothetical protein